MTAWQKAIKYTAVAFAILIIVSIVGKLAGLTAGITYLTDKKQANKITDSFTVSDNIESLKIELGAADLKLKAGDEFKVETDNEYITVAEKHKTLSITEKKKLFYLNDSNLSITITVPKEFAFRKVNISSGAGRFALNELVTEKLKMELGAGETVIKALTVTEEAEIDGGAGKLTIENGELYDLELNMGVGELEFIGLLKGENEINSGVGESNITLLGTPEDYRIEINKGLGKATVDGVAMQDGNIYGTGNTELEIDGGIGEIKVNFK